MFGDETSKILQKIREGLGDRIAKRLKKHKGVNLKKKKKEGIEEVEEPVG